MKLQMWYYITPITMGIIKKCINNAGEDIEKREPSFALAGNVLIQLLWRAVWRFIKNLKIGLPYDTAIPLLGNSLRKP